MNEETVGVSVGQTKEKWLEVMFYLSCFFGALHLAGVAGQVAGMIAHSLFETEISFKLQSSMLMGHLYLTFLAAYVGPKEFVRWLKRTDDEILSGTESKRITRGLYIVVGWAVFTGLVALLQQMSVIAEVPETLLYTLGEVVTLFCGTEVSKYLRNRQATQVKQDSSIRDNFSGKVIDYVKEHGGIDNSQCQVQYGLSQDQATRLLKSLVNAGKLRSTGSGRATNYVAA